MDILYRYDPHLVLESGLPKSNDEALQRLAVGNARFAELIERMQLSSEHSQAAREPFVVPIDPVRLGVPVVSGLEPEHTPFALVLGCSDARVPIEHVLDCSANDLFVVRVAGNVLGLECLGSVDYAASQLRENLKSVIVLGHTGCGAVTAAVDIYNSPADFGDIAFSHAVRSLLDRVMLAVRGSARALERRLGARAIELPQYRQWLIATAVYMNSAITAWDLQREIRAVAGEALPVSYTVYDMAHMRISSLPLRDPDDHLTTPQFAYAPVSSEEFVDVASRVVMRLMGEWSEAEVVS